MATTNSLRFTGSLAVFLGDLRAWVFPSQVKAAKYFGLTHSTVSRYENGHLKPHASYLICLVFLALDQITPAGQPVEGYQGALLPELNKVLHQYYPEEKSFRDWEELRQVAEGCLADYRDTGHAIELNPQQRIDWGEAPDVTIFYGRQEELDTLVQWIVTDSCRLVGVLGIGGVGKTTLVTKLTEQINRYFDVVIWRSLRNAPPFNDILNECLQFLSPKLSLHLAEDMDRKISHLIDHLRQSRCLVVLDNIEAILRGGDQAGQYCAGHEAYGYFLRRVGETRHQSCLLLTSREKPGEFAFLEGQALPVRTLQLAGLRSHEGQKILKDKALIGPEEAWHTLVDRYSGNPLALKFIAETIREVFAGDVTQFLGHEAAIFGGVRQLLDQQFGRLSPLELEIMYWLAIEREPASPAELRADLIRPLSVPALVEALQSLRHRSLIEKSGSGFTLQNVVLEYTTDRLVDQICAEVLTETFSLWQSHLLIKAQTKEYVRQSQARLILQPVAQWLTTRLGRVALEQKLKQMLGVLRTGTYLAPGYAGGNILNFLLHLGYNLRGWDFSELAIRQAYLREAQLPEVNFAQSDLTQSIFTDVFAGVSAVAFSPNGQLLAIATREEIRLWRMAGSQPQQILRGHSNLVWTVAFSPDGQTLASGGADQTIRLWDVNTGQAIAILHGHTNWIWSVTFSPNGQTLASGSADQTVRLWHVQTGETLRILEGHTGAVLAVAFSPDGITLVSGGEDQAVRLWDVKRGPGRTLQTESQAVFALAFNPGGEILASGGEDQTIRLWNVQTGHLLHAWHGHTHSISSLAFSPNGQILISGSYDQTIRLWEVSQGDQLLRTLQGHSQAIRSIALSPDGTTLASGSYDQTVRLWDIRTGYILHMLQGYIQQVLSVAFSPDGKTLASASADQFVRLWDAHTGQLLHILRGHNRWVASVAFSPDSSILASGSYDRTVRLWDTCTGQLLPILYRHPHWVRFAIFNPTGEIIASGGTDPAVHLWDIRTGQTRYILHGHTRPVRCAAFSPDGAILATGSEDQAIYLWNTRTGQAQRTLTKHSGAVSAVAFNLAGTLLASAGDDQMIRLWNTQTGHTLRAWRGHPQPVSGVAFSLDGTILASGSDDHTIGLWDVHTGQKLYLGHKHTSAVSSVAFSPDGTTLASAGLDGMVVFWQGHTGEYLKTLRSERPYERMNITGVIGLTEAQKATLKALGATEEFQES